MHLLNRFIIGFINRHKLLSVCIGALVLVYIVLRLFFVSPLTHNVYFSRAYYSRNDELLRVTLTPDEKYRIFTELKDISPALRNATVLYEDKYFYYHFGINPIATLRATLNYFRGIEHPAGSSTITMQVARLKYDLNTTTVSGKLQQIALAIYLEMFYTKSDILTAYLNLAPYGGNIEGIGAASLIYFHKYPSQLTTIEAITLATIPQNPTKRGLNSESGMQYLKNMRHDLVNRWLQKYPDDKKLITLSDMELARFRIRDLPFLAPHFVNREISKINYRDNTSYIKTTLDLNLQKQLERRLKSEVSRRTDIGIKNAAAMLVNYKTMQVLSYIGSVNYFDKEIYGENDGCMARRSPGSTLKPLIYAYAADLGLIHGMTLLKDAKINFGVYAPENSDNEFYGPVLARDALTHSRNIPAINLVKQIGVGNFHKLLNDLGVSGLKNPEHYGISIALGGAEISMQELATIYSTIANLGKYSELQTRISGNNETSTQLLSPESFFLVLDMLAHQNTPTNNIMFSENNQSPIRHYWKTGTSSSFRDAWTAGIFGDYVLIVWVGNFDGRPNNAFSGARAAAPIYFALAQTASDYFSSHGTPVINNNFLRNDLNIAMVTMCDGVGGIANEYCPKTTESYFIPGKSPIDTSTVYRPVKVDKKTGLRACNNNAPNTITRIYEFWDTEFLDMFRRAGIRRNTPPDFMPGCDLNKIASEKNPPIILSPVADTKIVILNNDDYAPVTLRAISDDKDADITWFLDNDIIGHTKSSNAFVHNIPMGPHTIHATYNGGTTSINFSIVK